MEATTLCGAPAPSRDGEARVAAKPKTGRCSSWQDEGQAAQSHLVLPWQGLAEAGQRVLPAEGSQEGICTQHPPRVGERVETCQGSIPLLLLAPAYCKYLPRASHWRLINNAAPRHAIRACQ